MDRDHLKDVKDLGKLLSLKTLSSNKLSAYLTTSAASEASNTSSSRATT